MSDFILSIKVFYIQHTAIFISLIAALAILIFIKPKQFGKVLAALAILVLIGYGISSLTNVVNSGIEKNYEAGSRTDKQYRESGL